MQLLMPINQNRKMRPNHVRGRKRQTITNDAECVRDIRTNHGRRCEEKPTRHIVTPKLIEVFGTVLQYNFRNQTGNQEKA